MSRASSWVSRVRAMVVTREPERRVVRDDVGVSTLEVVVIAVALVGLALLATALLPPILQGWISQIPTGS